MVFGGERAPLSERARRPTVVLTSRCTAAVKLSHMVAPTTHAAKKEHLPSSWLAAFGSISAYVWQVGVEHVWELHLTYLPPSLQSGVTGSTLLTYPPGQPAHA